MPLGKVDGDLRRSYRSPEKAMMVGPLSRDAIEADVAAFKSDLGQAVFRDLHAGARQLHLLAQILHLDDREAGIVSDDDDVGGLEDLPHRGHLLAFAARSTASSLRLAGRLMRDYAGLMPVVRHGGTTRKPAPPSAATPPRFTRFEPKGIRPEGTYVPRRVYPRSSPVYAGPCELSRFRRQQSRTGLANPEFAGMAIRVQESPVSSATS